MASKHYAYRWTPISHLCEYKTICVLVWQLPPLIIPNTIVFTHTWYLLLGSVFMVILFRPFLHLTYITFREINVSSDNIPCMCLRLYYLLYNAGGVIMILPTLIYLLEWDMHVSLCKMHTLHGLMLWPVHVLNLGCYHTLICHPDPFWTTWMFCNWQLCVHLSKLYILGFW